MLLHEGWTGATLLQKERSLAHAVHGFDAPGDGELRREAHRSAPLRAQHVGGEQRESAVALAAEHGNSLATQSRVHRVWQVREDQQR